MANNQGAAVHCIYHGIDLDLFTSQGFRYSCSPPYNLLTVARITPKKGLPTIYQALRRLKESGLDFEHTLIGDGDDREAVLKLIEELELGDRCSWLGTLPHEAVRDHFVNSDLFILGSRIGEDGDRDGIPNVLVESLAMGVPAVATNVSSIPEILINGTTGLTVNQQDSSALAAAIVTLLTDQELRKNVIDNGRDHVRENFDNSRLITDLARLFIDADSQLGRHVKLGLKN
ncbi:MAG: glycosyltransferase family 4 protein [Desulfofustis sp.]